MITYETKNTRIEGDEIIVFFEFSNGEVNSHRFPITTTVLDIQNWANEKAQWFNDRGEQIKALQEQILLINEEEVWL